MPRFYFNVDDGEWNLDETGTELPNLTAARHHAVRLTASILAEQIELVKPGSDWMMEVTDSTGLLLVRLDLTLIEYPTETSDPGSFSQPSSGRVDNALSRSVQRLLERIAEQIGIPLSDLAEPFIAASPPFQSADERAATVAKLEALMARVIGPRDLIIRLLAILGASHH